MEVRGEKPWRKVLLRVKLQMSSQARDNVGGSKKRTGNVSLLSLPDLFFAMVENFQII